MTESKCFDFDLHCHDIAMIYCHNIKNHENIAMNIAMNIAENCHENIAMNINSVFSFIRHCSSLDNGIALHDGDKKELLQSTIRMNVDEC